MAQLEKIGRVATKIYEFGTFTKIKYHKTDVVSFNDYEIILNSNGWRTQTTKNRMNQASNEFDLGFTVYQRDSVWYVDYKGETLKFVDHMRLNR